MHCRKCLVCSCAGKPIDYKEGHVDGAARTTLKNHWATPDEHMQALIKGLSLETERFASPLNFTPSMKHYFSLYEADACLGQIIMLSVVHGLVRLNAILNTSLLTWSTRFGGPDAGKNGAENFVRS